MEKLKQTLESKVNLTPEDWLFIREKIQTKTLKNKEILTETNSIEKNIYFIEEGVFRLFIELEEKDITFDFAFANDFTCSYTSFLTQTKSDCAIQSLSESTVQFINHDDLYEMYQKTQSGEAIGRVLAEELFMYKSKREISLLKDSPTERYLQLFKEQPHLIQEIPQKYLSSYIGITPQALSRIRAKIN